MSRRAAMDYEETQRFASEEPPWRTVMSNGIVCGDLHPTNMLRVQTDTPIGEKLPNFERDYSNYAGCIAVGPWGAWEKPLSSGPYANTPDGPRHRDNAGYTEVEFHVVMLTNAPDEKVDDPDDPFSVSQTVLRELKLQFGDAIEVSVKRVKDYVPIKVLKRRSAE